jgi:hypothetical protein
VVRGSALVTEKETSEWLQVRPLMAMGGSVGTKELETRAGVPARLW